MAPRQDLDQFAVESHRRAIAMSRVSSMMKLYQLRRYKTVQIKATG